jgi:iron complex outermembrane receptor protein
LEAYADTIASTNLGQHGRGRGAGYAALDIRALRRFSLSLGGREESYGSFGRQFSPSAAAGYWLNERTKLRASASRAFRIPTYTDLFYSDPRTLGNPNLKPESAWSLEAGVDWIGNSNLRADAVWFQRRERNGIDYVRRPEELRGVATNYNNLRFNGAELSLGTRVRGQQLDFRYTAIHAGRDVLGNLISRYTFNYASHLGVVSWMGTRGNWSARVRAGGTQRYGLDPYGVADIYLARTRGHVRPFLQLTNFTDTRYQEIAGVPMPGRGVLGGLELSLGRTR